MFHCLHTIRMLIVMFALPLQSMAQESDAKITHDFNLCSENLEEQFTELARRTIVSSGFELCPNSNPSLGLILMRINAPDPFRHLASMFAARTPGYRSKKIEGKVSFRFKPYRENVWSVDTFDDYGNLDEKTDFVWARNFSFDGMPWGNKSMDWYPVRYFDCYKVLPKDSPRAGLNCET